LEAHEGRKGAMDVVTEPIEGGALIRISGDWDIYSAPKLHAALNKAFGEGPVKLVLDLSNVDFLGTAGISELVLCIKRMEKTGGSLRLFGLQPGVLNALKLTNMDALFQIFESEKEALK